VKPGTTPIGVEFEEQLVKPGETFKKSFARGSKEKLKFWRFSIIDILFFGLH